MIHHQNFSVNAHVMSRASVPSATAKNEGDMQPACCARLKTIRSDPIFTPLLGHGRYAEASGRELLSDTCSCGFPLEAVLVACAANKNAKANCARRQIAAYGNWSAERLKRRLVYK